MYVSLADLAPRSAVLIKSQLTITKNVILYCVLILNEVKVWELFIPYHD